jgi:hypothetical protein
MAVASATVIEIGDIITGVTAGAEPASSVTYSSTLAATQEAAHDIFVGVAAQRSRSGDDDDIRVVYDGIVEFDCASATFEIGDRVGVDDNGGGTALMDQQVIAVAAGSPQLAIGRVVKTYASATTKVLVKIQSVLLGDGAQAVA